MAFCPFTIAISPFTLAILAFTMRRFVRSRRRDLGVHDRASYALLAYLA
jgi:hypothetical protein